MSKYGSGLTFGQVCNQEKEEIKQALAGKVIDYYDFNENPFYRDGVKEETDRVILEAYDEAVYQALEAMTAGRTMERLFLEVTGKPMAYYFETYAKIRAEEAEKYHDYEYEGSDEHDN